MPTGSGRKRSYATMEDSSNITTIEGEREVGGRLMIEIKSGKTLCLPRAIVVGLAYIDHKNGRRRHSERSWRSFRYEGVQVEEARKPLDNVGIQKGTDFDINDVMKIQKHLKEVQCSRISLESCETGANRRFRRQSSESAAFPWPVS